MEGEGTSVCLPPGPGALLLPLSLCVEDILVLVPTAAASAWGPLILPAPHQLGKATWEGQQARCPEALPPLCAGPGAAAQLLPCCVAAGRTPSRPAPPWLASVCHVCEVSRSARVHLGAFSVPFRSPAVTAVTRTLLETTSSCTSLHTPPCTPPWPQEKGLSRRLPPGVTRRTKSLSQAAPQVDTEQEAAAGREDGAAAELGTGAP